MRGWRALFFALALMQSSAGFALDLNLPSNARETASENSALDDYFAPVGVFADGALPGVAVKGEVRRSAFRIATAGLTPLQVLEPLRLQLEAEGYEVILDCAAARCGGFDFRFATETLPAPAMHISLRNFHFLTGVIGPDDAPERVVTMLASTSPAAAHVQIIQAGALGDAPDQFTRTADLPQSAKVPVQRPEARPEAEEPAEPPTLPPERIVLVGLDFGRGAQALGEGPFDALAQLAEALNQNPDLIVALVGHTDNTGPLDVNISISRQRAAAVRQRLIDAYGISSRRVTAHGVGFLSPIADNATEAGRTANRRVEAVFLPES